MCGEKFPFCLSACQNMGSPPHVRGEVSVNHKQGVHVGITPACAGRSISDHSCKLTYQDHPRMCGEKAPLVMYAMCSKGSPPHVRGEVSVNHQQNILVRITPACAGRRLKKSHYYGISFLYPAVIRSVCDKAQVPGSNQVTLCGRSLVLGRNALPQL